MHYDEICRVGMYQDTGSVKPGSVPMFYSVSGSEKKILVSYAIKILFACVLEINFVVLQIQNPVPWFWLADPNFMYRAQPWYSYEIVWQTSLHT